MNKQTYISISPEKLYFSHLRVFFQEFNRESLEQVPEPKEEVQIWSDQSWTVTSMVCTISFHHVAK